MNPFTGDSFFLYAAEFPLLFHIQDKPKLKKRSSAIGISKIETNENLEKQHKRLLSEDSSDDHASAPAPMSVAVPKKRSASTVVKLLKSRMRFICQ